MFFKTSRVAFQTELRTEIIEGLNTSTHNMFLWPVYHLWVYKKKQKFLLSFRCHDEELVAIMSLQYIL